MIYDICTGDKYSYFNEFTGKYEYESIEERLLEVKKISLSSYKDLKRIVRYIFTNFTCQHRNKDNPNNMIEINSNTLKATWISLRFDDVFIHNVIEQYYHGELNIGGKNNAN